MAGGAGGTGEGGRGEGLLLNGGLTNGPYVGVLWWVWWVRHVSARTILTYGMEEIRGRTESQLSRHGVDGVRDGCAFLTPGRSVPI